MKVLYLTSRFPYPLERGDKLRAYFQIKELSKYHDIILVSIIEDTPLVEHIQKLEPFVDKIIFCKLTWFQKMLNVIKYIYTDIPLQSLLFYIPSLKKNIFSLVETEKIDVMYCQLARVVPYIIDLPALKILDYMDAFGVGMKMRSKLSSWPLSMIYRIESKKMIAYEKLIQKHFDHCTVISHADAQLLELDSRSPFSILENGVYVEEINEGLIEKKYDISFIGNMGYLPNIEAAISLAKEIIPALDPHVRLLIAGARPEASVKALANDSRVTVTGWVDDIRIAYLSSKVFVAPLYSGTGQQNKILEAMSLGIPCITTPQVNRSIGARPDEEILIAENNIQFIQILKKVLNDTERLNRISSNAYTFVKKRFSWEQKGIQLSSIIDKIHNNTTS